MSNYTNQKLEALTSAVVRRFAAMARPLVLAVLITIMGAATLSTPAQAATPHASDWSPAFGNVVNGENRWFVNGCSVYAGPAKDNLHGVSTFHFIAAGQVYCASSRQVYLEVHQQRWINGVVQEVGTNASWGTHSTSNVWIPTGPACKGGANGAYFRSVVWAVVDGRASGWLYGRWGQAPGQGCLN